MRQYSTIFLPNNLCDGDGIYTGRFAGDTIPYYVLSDGFQTMDLPLKERNYLVGTAGNVEILVIKNIPKHDQKITTTACYDYNFVTIASMPSKIKIYTSVNLKDRGVNLKDHNHYCLEDGWEYWEFDVYFSNGLLDSVIVTKAPYHDQNIFAHSTTTTTTTLPNDKVEIELELPNDLLLKLSLQAHEKDITLNQHIVNILEKAIKNGKNI